MNAINYITTSPQEYAFEAILINGIMLKCFYKHNTKFNFRYLNLIFTSIM